MNLILDYESSALAAPQSFLDAMQTAANILDSTIQDNITVTIQVGYNDFYNNQITGLGTSAVGGDLYRLLRLLHEPEGRARQPRNLHPRPDLCKFVAEHDLGERDVGLLCPVGG